MIHMVAHLRADFDRADGDQVGAAGIADHIHLETPLQFRDRALGNQDDPFAHFGAGANPGVLAGPEHIAGIVKQHRHLNGAGARLHLAVQEIKLPLLRIDGPVGQDQFQFQFAVPVLAPRSNIPPDGPGSIVR